MIHRRTRLLTLILLTILIFPFRWFIFPGFVSVLFGVPESMVIAPIPYIIGGDISLRSPETVAVLQAFDISSDDKDLVINWKLTNLTVVNSGSLETPHGPQTGIVHAVELQVGTYIVTASMCRSSNDDRIFKSNRFQCGTTTIYIIVEPAVTDFMNYDAANHEHDIANLGLDDSYFIKLTSPRLYTYEQNYMKWDLKNSFKFSISNARIKALAIRKCYWSKLSRSTTIGDIRPVDKHGTSVLFTGLAEGTYRIGIVCDNDKSDIPKSAYIVIVVRHIGPGLMYPYDPTFSIGQDLLPFIFKGKPVTPSCTHDAVLDVEVPLNEALLSDTLNAAFSRIKRVGTRRIIMTFVTETYVTLALNLLCSLRHIFPDGKDAYGAVAVIIVALDVKSQQALYETRSNGDDELSVSVFFDENLVSLAGRLNFVSKDEPDAKEIWRNVMRVKTRIIRLAVNLGYDALIMDADTAMIRNPFEHLLKFDQICDFQFQSEVKIPQNKFHNEPLNSLSYLYAGFNAGLYYVKSNKKSVKLFNDWVNAYKCTEARREQLALQISLHNTFRGQWVLMDSAYSKDPPPNVIRLCMVHPSVFANGAYILAQEKFTHIFLEQNKKPDEKKGDVKSPDVVHMNQLSQNERKKIDALKKSHAWFLNENLRQCSATSVE